MYPFHLMQVSLGISRKHLLGTLICTLGAMWAPARDIVVAKNGDDSSDGHLHRPLLTIQAAANMAMPGDTIIVHQGIYRERIDPPRGGESDAKRITYQAKSGVTVTGSEIIKGWTHIAHDTWQVVLPNSFFGSFNPYADEIRGDWFNPMGRKHHTGAVYGNKLLAEAATAADVMKPATDTPLWHATVDQDHTTIRAQFPGMDPNQSNAEINVRQTVFYPSKTGIHYITVKGFCLEQAATNWAPPTAEQMGLIGTNWSKGWIIEDNIIRHSTCVGIALGKHGDSFDNTSANSAEGYVATIKRGLAAGWSKEKVGSHVVRNNHISHCEQAGIVGSLGAAFSTITGNEIHHIHVRQRFGGAEQAGIKIHGAIDTLIAGNFIHHCNRGIWLDWMAQGTRVTRNVLTENTPQEDVFMEVNHGPYMIDHNLFLSATSLADWSQGGAYCHNLFAGKVLQSPELKRETPWLEEHGTKLAGLMHIQGGDNRFYHNLFIHPASLDSFKNTTLPNTMVGNEFPEAAKLCPQEQESTIAPMPSWELRLYEQKVQINLELNIPSIPQPAATIVTTDLLGSTLVSRLPFVQPDGSPYRMDVDFRGTRRLGPPRAGPFENLSTGTQTISVWPTRWMQ